ncbi:hypothetical protein [Flavihumibacter petaseus]|uniref:Uncharacterized protein n=1 Tax=Flavihumibacter petaseus NBRC 106054 TaxID=1220578 RepID=A0A0E9MVU6_9BACT|nr:hypothetical protein [Flavihumibacter petaseus]GAO41250.1 hypothetical protein FPE01S_01_02620 [Flavihumibacter petaseus NBRC 106054]
MSTQDPFLKEEKKLPSLLNVLTILTFVGCAVDLISNGWNFISGRKNLDKLEELQTSGQLDNAPEFMKKLAGPEALERARVAYENRVPILIIVLVGVCLCAYGAIQMRKLQKSGYFMWLIGEILPIIGSIIFLGIGFAGGMSWILLFPVLFIILYTTQLKYLR